MKEWERINHAGYSLYIYIIYETSCLWEAAGETYDQGNIGPWESTHVELTFIMLER